MHTYCITALILHRQRIYCEKCKGYYYLLARWEKICTSRFISRMIKYIIILFLLILVSGIFIVIDAFLKTQEAKEADLLASTSDDSFKFRQVYWIVLVPMLIVLLITFVWCFYFKFIKDFIQTRRLVLCEVLDREKATSRITRVAAKQNLMYALKATKSLH